MALLRLRRVLSRTPRIRSRRLAHSSVVEADGTHEDPGKKFPGYVVYGRPTVRVQKVGDNKLNANPFCLNLADTA